MLGALDLGVGRPDAARPGAECRRPQRELVRVVRYSTARCDFADFMCRVRLRMMLFLVHQVINGKTPTFPFPPLSCLCCRVPSAVPCLHRTCSPLVWNGGERRVRVSAVTSQLSREWRLEWYWLRNHQGPRPSHQARCCMHRTTRAPRPHQNVYTGIRQYGTGAMPSSSFNAGGGCSRVPVLPHAILHANSSLQSQALSPRATTPRHTTALGLASSGVSASRASGPAPDPTASVGRSCRGN